MGGFDFGDFSGMAYGAVEEIALDNAEEAKLLGKSPTVMVPEPEMTEQEALDIFDAAEAMGIGADLHRVTDIGRQVLENESLAIADDLIEGEPDASPTSLKSRKTRVSDTHSRVSERLKCPFEEWMQDVCAGRKTINDPVGGANSYGKSKY